MSKVYPCVDDTLRAFMLRQQVFFVGTAPDGPGGHVNVSPKGGTGTFAVLGEREVAYVDYTGSGAETVAHLRQNGRIVLMFCSFDHRPKIVRLHGHGEVVFAAEDRFGEITRRHFAGVDLVGVRAVIRVDVERVSDSCGFGVPVMTTAEARPTMASWQHTKQDNGMLDAYRVEKNVTSIDGLPALPVGGV